MLQIRLSDVIHAPVEFEDIVYEESLDDFEIGTSNDSVVDIVADISLVLLKTASKMILSVLFLSEMLLSGTPMDLRLMAGNPHNGQHF